MPHHIYLDHASSSPRHPVVCDVRSEFELAHYANRGRSNYSLAEEAETYFQNSKKQVSQWIGCSPHEVIYTMSATYAINLLALAMEHNNYFQKGDQIILSISEHHANIVPWQMLAERIGIEILFVQLDAHYRIDLEHLRSLFSPRVKAVSLQYASNVTGAIHELQHVREIIGSSCFFCIDATQMVLHGPLDMTHTLRADAVVFSGHKMMADTGIGVLALSRTWQKRWQSPISGGGAIATVSLSGHTQAGSPERWEPGTSHITGAVTLSGAIDVLRGLSPEIHENYTHMRDFLRAGFAIFQTEGLILYHSMTDDALGIFSFEVLGKHHADVANFFASHEVCVRSGHHCCQPLHTALSSSGSVRVSLGYTNTITECETFFRYLQHAFHTPSLIDTTV